MRFVWGVFTTLASSANLPEDPDAHLFFVVKHETRFTAMPATDLRHSPPPVASN